MRKKQEVRIYRWRSTSEHGNFGDEITLPIIERLFGLKAIPSRIRAAELLGAGSVLGNWAMQSLKRKLWEQLLMRRSGNLHVWGTGLIVPMEVKWPQRLHFHAVRGRLTAEHLGVASALGDPGILASLIVEKPNQKQFAVGIVPHFVDVDAVTRSIPLPLNWTVINPEWPVDEVLAKIAACEVVASSSLHGLITADSFGIPCVWLSSWTPLYANSAFKFRDYETSRQSPFNDPLTYEQLKSMDVNQISAIATTPGRPMEAWQKQLLDVFPFR